MQTERESKAFFVAAILAQASREGLTLSENEQQMLRFSEADPEFVVDEVGGEELQSEPAARAYETKIAGLIRRAHDHDLTFDAGADTAYQGARDSLARGDHYLMVMIDEALGARPDRRPINALAKGALLLVLLPAATLAVVIVVGLAAILVTGQTHTVREALPFGAGLVVFAGMSWYLVRLVIREVRS
jgi:hypothetical protein